LNDEGLIFTDYSTDYFPNKEDIVRYLNDFAITNKLNILYDTEVIKINKDEMGYTIITKNIKTFENHTYNCEKLITATGLSKLVKPENYNIKKPIKHYGEYEKDYFKNPENLLQYRNKFLLIIGNGNAAYELANLLNNICSKILIIGKKPKEWAISTHYTGDLRATYLPYLETFLLKSNNAITNTEIIDITQETFESKYKLLNIPIYEFDDIIICTGWKFDTSIFNFDIDLTSNNKYPVISHNYESSNNKNLFFIGSLMHSLDFKKSSGGFIHGFRYLIKYFFNLNYDNKYNINKFNSTDSLVDHVVYKINETSPMYQMYGQLCDIFYLDSNDNSYKYYNDVHFDFYKNSNIARISNTYIFVIKLEYGKKTLTNIYDFGLYSSGLGNESNSNLLHPVLYVYKNILEIYHQEIIDIIHFDEDLFAQFSGNSRYIEKIRRILKMFSN
jgi:thioredoxin reductase